MDKFNSHLSIIGIPFCGGQPRKGVEHGPSHLRRAGLLNIAQEIGWNVHHDSDVEVENEPEQVELVGEEGTIKLKNPTYVGATCKKVFQAVDERASKGDFILTLGGDHSIAAGSIPAILKNRPNSCVIWIDAHADINTPSSTDSGNLHGMPVALAMGEVKGVRGFEWIDNLPNKLAANSIAYIGLRDVDKGEKEMLRRHKIAAYSMHDVDEFGIAAVVQKALSAVNPNLDRPIHLSFDIDALDPVVAPSTGTPVRGGLTLREGRFLCEKLYQTKLLASMDLTEVNPKLSDDAGREITIRSALTILKAALGFSLL